jgi:drug/metabolite transporter (DMT)-like permease
MTRRSFGIPPTVSLIIASALWAVATVISKALLATVSPIAVLVLQLAPSVAALWLLIFALGGPTLSRNRLLPLAALGWLNPGLSYTLGMFGLAHTTASVTTLLWAAEPALIVAAAWLVLRETITPRLLALMAVAGGGVLLVGGLSGTADTSGSASGPALVLAGVLCCAFYTVFSRKIADDIDPLSTVAVQQSVALVWATALWQGWSGVTAVDPTALTGGTLAIAAISGLMYYAAAFWFYLTALRQLPASTAGMFLNLIPVFGIATAFLTLGERLTLGQWIGAAAICLSISALITTR